MRHKARHQRERERERVYKCHRHAMPPRCPRQPRQPRPYHACCLPPSSQPSSSIHSQRRGYNVVGRQEDAMPLLSCLFLHHQQCWQGRRGREGGREGRAGRLHSSLTLAAYLLLLAKGRGGGSGDYVCLERCFVTALFMRDEWHAVCFILLFT